MSFVKKNILLNVNLNAFSKANSSASNISACKPRLHERLSEFSALKFLV